jgi:hypothetical protein
MMAQDLTKFAVVLVLLGLILAIAVFRPQVLPPLTNKPNEKPSQAPDTNTVSNPGQRGGEEGPYSYEDLLARQEELRQCEYELNQRDTSADQREAELNQRQAELDKQRASLRAWEERLSEQASLLAEKENKVAEQLATVQAEQVRLVQERDSLQAGQARLAQEREEVQSERTYLDEEWARLRVKEANLGEWEQKLKGHHRLSIAAVVISGLLSVPSAVFLMALMRQSQQMPKRQAQQSQGPQTHQEEQAIHHGRVPTKDLVPMCGDNGRDKESVDHFLQVRARSGRSTNRSGEACEKPRGSPATRRHWGCRYGPA